MESMTLQSNENQEAQDNEGMEWEGGTFKFDSQVKNKKMCLWPVYQMLRLFVVSERSYNSYVREAEIGV